MLGRSLTAHIGRSLRAIHARLGIQAIAPVAPIAITVAPGVQQILIFQLCPTVARHITFHTLHAVLRSPPPHLRRQRQGHGHRMGHIRSLARPCTPLGRTILTRSHIAHRRTHRRGQLPRAHHRPLSTARLSASPIDQPGPASPQPLLGPTRRCQPVRTRSHGPIAQP